MRGLLIRSPWIEEILRGRKTWEIRGSNTNIRGRIGLIRSGSGLVVGTCDLVDVEGPLYARNGLSINRNGPEWQAAMKPLAKSAVVNKAKINELFEQVGLPKAEQAAFWGRMKDAFPKKAKLY
jgi:hypothetical protein